MNVRDITKAAMPKNTTSRELGSRRPTKSLEEIKAWRAAQDEKAKEEDRLAIQARLAAYLRNKLGSRFKSRRFETYEPAPENVKAFEICKRYAERTDYKDGSGLLIVGLYGVGKTHMAAAITNRLLDRDIPVLFDTFAGHIARLQAEFNSGEPRKHLELMKNVAVLILDDVGKEKVTEWTSSILFDVINSRYEADKPVIITTNYNADELRNYLGGATYSRICETCPVVELKGSDYRLR